VFSARICCAAFAAMISPVDDDRRVRHVRFDDMSERRHHRSQVCAVQRGFRVGRRVAGGEQQFVALAQRQAKRLGEPDDHAATWRRTTALDEAQVPLGGAGLDRELELADPVGAAAFPERGREVHVFSNSPSAGMLAIPRGELPGCRPVRKMALMDDTVKLGVLVPSGRAQWGPEADPRTLTCFAMRAENLGYDSLWVNDFLLTPRIEALTMLAAMAPLTSRVMLGTAVLLPVLRRPVKAAQTLASIDLLSGGRLVLTVGAAFPGGFGVPQHTLSEVPWDRRFTRLDETVALWRQLWVSPEGGTSFHGDLLDFDDLPAMTMPFHPGGPPIWLGGASESALRRVGRRYDGWLPYPPAAQSYREGAGRSCHLAATPPPNPGRYEPGNRNLQCAAGIPAVVRWACLQRRSGSQPRGRLPRRGVHPARNRPGAGPVLRLSRQRAGPADRARHSAADQRPSPPVQGRPGCAVVSGCLSLPLGTARGFRN
jgi:Luciferase-like monooxygenase